MPPKTNTSPGSNQPSHVSHTDTNAINSTIPKIEVIWKFDPISDHVNFSITNNGDHVVKVSPSIDVRYSNSDLNAASQLFSPTDAGTIGVVILFIGAPRYDLAHEEREGPSLKPLEIGAGKTREVILTSRQLISFAKGATKANFYLFLHKQVINTFTIDNFNNILKQK